MAKRNDKQRNGQRDRAVDLLLAGKSNAEVAAELEVRRETVWRWANVTEVAAELRARRLAGRDALAGDLAELGAEALAVLRDLLRDADTPPAVRAKVAAGVLDRLGLTDKAAVEALARDREAEAPDPLDSMLAGLG